ncbi:MAG: hypothetical protein HUJ77_14945 [Clostridium sp.]|uniref:hypothetical protein n=1 Tax=Clostridium sp. TaxID=1506 RepID=UPI0025BC6005|nr:hypothetical protein [Clostridium sp.]MCF0149680.1 hypothetical protein [Clostridium sp.]
MYITKIYFLALLKITYEVFVGLIITMILMAIISIIKGDKCYFRKKIDKLWRYMYGEL